MIEDGRVIISRSKGCLGKIPDQETQRGKEGTW
jgi:hypothetical protein